MEGETVSLDDTKFSEVNKIHSKEKKWGWSIK